MNSANYATYQKEKKKMMENFAKGLSAFPLDVSISYQIGATKWGSFILIFLVI